MPLDLLDAGHGGMFALDRGHQVTAKPGDLDSSRDDGRLVIAFRGCRE
jgi:hypothetical protein